MGASASGVAEAVVAPCGPVCLNEAERCCAEGERRCAECPGRCRCGEAASSSSVIPRSVPFDERPELGKATAEGVATAVVRGTARFAETPAEARRRQAPLREHFLSAAYTDGEDMDADMTAYCLESSASRVVQYTHVPSGIAVWHQAIHLAPASHEGKEVLFHYTNADIFDKVVSAVVIDAQLWHALHQPIKRAGTEVAGIRGVYASHREPQQLAKFLESLPWWATHEKYCIPLIVTRDMIISAEQQGHQQTPVLLGTNVSASRTMDRDLWLIVCQDEEDALANASEHTEQRLRNVVSACEADLGSLHEDTLDSIGYLAYFLDTCGKLDQAEPLYRRALQGYEHRLGPRHDGALRNANNLAALLQAIGAIQEAEPLCRRALIGCETKFGADHPHTIVSVNNLAHLCKTLGRLDEARPLFRRVLQWRERELGAGHADTILSMSNLALALQGLGMLEEAEHCQRRALRFREAALGGEHRECILNTESLARVLLDQGRSAEAALYFERALAWKECHLGSGHEEVLATTAELGGCRERAGDYDGALPLLQRVVAWQRGHIGLDDPRAQETLRTLVRVFRATDKAEQAEALDRLVIQDEGEDDRGSPFSGLDAVLERDPEVVRLGEVVTAHEIIPGRTAEPARLQMELQAGPDHTAVAALSQPEQTPERQPEVLDSGAAPRSEQTDCPDLREQAVTANGVPRGGRTVRLPAHCLAPAVSAARRAREAAAAWSATCAEGCSWCEILLYVLSLCGREGG